MSLVKHELQMLIASSPDTLITAKADTPEGVAGATMVSVVWMGRRYGKVC